VLDQEEALRPESVKIWPDGNVSLDAKNEAKPEVYRRGDVEEGFRTAEHVFEDRYTPQPTYTTHRWSPVFASLVGKGTSSLCIPRPKAPRIAAMTCERFGDTRRESARHLQIHGRADSATRTRIRMLT